MSRTFTLSFLSMLSIASAAAAAPATPTQPSPGRTIGFTPSSVHVTRFETPATPVCSPRYDRTIYSARPYCPDFGEARQLFITGQVIPAGVGQPIGFAQLTPALRSEYKLDPDRDYVFASGYLYDIDHGTKAVRRVIPVEIGR